MVDQPIPISEIADPDLIRVQLLASGRPVHAPLSALGAFYDWATVTHAAAAKTTPADADEFSLADSAAGFIIKKITWGNIKTALNLLYQPLASTLTSWAAITRASGFDTFVATPSSANLAALLTDETGTGAAVFAGAPTITGIPIFSGIPSLTGGALTFPATQVPSAGANDLDDYEEGTFTPTIVGLTTAGAGTYSVQVGNYVKIGKQVFVQIALVWSAHTGTGNMQINGLPFTIGGGNSTPLSCNQSVLTYAGELKVTATAGNTFLTILTNATGGAETLVAMDTAATLRVAGSYLV